MKKLSKGHFYFLSYTWGLPLSLVGLGVCGVLRCFGYKPQKYGYCYYIEIGENWGGVSFGWLFLIGSNAPTRSKNHELGHGYQNACQYGWLMPMLSIISAARYWFARLGVKFDYYAWSFESNANKIGNEIMSTEEVANGSSADA